MTLERNLKEQFRENLAENVKLSNYSWFNLGGNADFFFKPKDKDHLKNFLKEANKKDLKTTILGAGSNTLFRDKGFRGVVIKLGKEFSYINKIDKNIIDVGAAYFPFSEYHFSCVCQSFPSIDQLILPFFQSNENIWKSSENIPLASLYLFPTYLFRGHTPP